MINYVFQIFLASDVDLAQNVGLLIGVILKDLERP